MTEPPFTVDYRDTEPRAFLLRLRRCYLLAAEGLTFGPPSTTLVHGSIRGPGAPRISHAWLSMADGSVWEPVAARLYPDGEAWKAFVRAVIEREYPYQEAIRLVLSTRQYGPWH